MTARESGINAWLDLTICYLATIEVSCDKNLEVDMFFVFGYFYWKKCLVFIVCLWHCPVLTFICANALVIVWNTSNDCCSKFLWTVFRDLFLHRKKKLQICCEDQLVNAVQEKKCQIGRVDACGTLALTVQDSEQVLVAAKIEVQRRLSCSFRRWHQFCA